MLDSVLVIVGLEVTVSHWFGCGMPWAIKDDHVYFCLRFNKNLKPCSHTLQMCFPLSFLSDVHCVKKELTFSALNLLGFLFPQNTFRHATVGKAQLLNALFQSHGMWHYIIEQSKHTFHLLLFLVINSSYLVNSEYYEWSRMKYSC